MYTVKNNNTPLWLVYCYFDINIIREQYIYLISNSTGLWLWQTEHIHGIIWHKHSLTVNSHHDDRTTIEVITSIWSLRIFSSVSAMQAATFCQGNSDMNHKLWNIEYQLRDMHSICKCCWNVATYKWEN